MSSSLPPHRRFIKSRREALPEEGLLENVQHFDQYQLDGRAADAEVYQHEPQTKIQDEISTGKSVATAKDNSAVWAISKVMEADVNGFKAISDSFAWRIHRRGRPSCLRKRSPAC